MLIAVNAACHAVPYTVQLNPTADAFVRSLAPGSNYGAAGALAVSGASALNGSGAQMGLLDTFMRFDLGSVIPEMDAQFGTGNWAFTDATLMLTEDPAPNDSRFNRGVGQFEIRWITADAWLEGTGTPNSPKTDGVRYSDEPSLLNPLTDITLGVFSNTLTAADHYYPLDLADSFTEDLMAAGDVSFFLTAADSSVGFTFYSRTVSGGRPFPALRLTADESQAVPEPATAALLLAGMLAGAARRRRNRRVP